MKNMAQIIANVNKWERHAGKSDLLKYFDGKQLTRNQAIRAKCYECVQGENTAPCTVLYCPLKPYCQWNS